MAQRQVCRLKSIGKEPFDAGASGPVIPFLAAGLEA